MNFDPSATQWQRVNPGQADAGHRGPDRLAPTVLPPPFRVLEVVNDRFNHFLTH
jgi:hypothetical protein